MKHALTVDVEDYFHVSAFANTIDRNQWGDLPSRVENSTHTLLDLFAERNIKATFFVLGWVAERNPELVKAIAAQGHEVACHGYSHQLIYKQTPAVFKEETFRAKSLLEDIIGKRVKGYRAASYSITPSSIWALDILVEAGFDYDSSIFPVRHDRYGMPEAPASIHIAKAPGGGQLVEFPLSSAKFMSARVPAAGGGYFRLYPYWLTRLLLKRSVKEINQPFIFYLHPWEVDVDQPRVSNASALSTFRHYQNLSRCLPRLNRLLSDFEFGTVEDVIEQQCALKAPSSFSYASNTNKQ